MMQDVLTEYENKTFPQRISHSKKCSNYDRPCKAQKKVQMHSTPDYEHWLQIANFTMLKAKYSHRSFCPSTRIEGKLYKKIAL